MPLDSYKNNIRIKPVINLEVEKGKRNGAGKTAKLSVETGRGLWVKVGSINT